MLLGCASDAVTGPPAKSDFSTLPTLNSTPEETPIATSFVLHPPSPIPTLLLLITPSPVPKPTPSIEESSRGQEQNAKTNPEDVVVYITNTGECYHRGGCRYLHTSKIETTKSRAIAEGYRPCKVCKP